MELYIKYVKRLFLLMIVSFSFSFSSGTIYYSKCVSCHGSNGKKSALGISAIIGGQKYSKTVQQLKDYQSGKLNLYGYGGLMKDKTLGLEDDVILAIAKYIETMK